MMRVQADETSTSVIAFEPKKGPPNATMVADDAGLSPWCRRRRIWRRQTATEPWILPTVFPPNCGQPKKERANLRHRQTIFGTAPLIVHQCTPIVVSNYEQL